MGCHLIVIAEDITSQQSAVVHFMLAVSPPQLFIDLAVHRIVKQDHRG